MNSRAIKIILLITVLLFVAGVVWAIIAIVRQPDEKDEATEDASKNEILIAEPVQDSAPTTEIKPEKVAEKPKAAKKTYKKPVYIIEYYEETISVSASASASASASSNGANSSSHAESHSE